MSDPKPSNPIATSRGRRWFWKGLLGVVLGLLLLLGLGGFWVYRDQTYFFNQALSRVESYDASIQRAQVSFKGDFELEGLKLSDPQTQALLIEVPKVSGKLDWQDLYRLGRIEKLEIIHPKIHLDLLLATAKSRKSNTVLAPLVEQVVEASREKEAAPAPEQSKLYHLEDFKVNGLEVAFGSQVLTLDGGVQALQFKEGKPHAAGHVTLKGKLGSPAAAEIKDLFVLQGSLQDRLVLVEDLTLQTLTLDQPLLEWITSFNTENSSEKTLSENQAQDLGFDEIQLKKFEWRDFKWDLHLLGLKTNGLMNLTIEDGVWKPQAPWMTGKIRLTLEPFQVTSTQSEELLRVPKISVEARLQANQEVEVESLVVLRPTLHWGPEFQSVIGKLSGNSTPQEIKKPWRVTVKQAKLSESLLDLKFGEVSAHQMQVRSHVQLELNQVVWNGEKVSSPQAQRLIVEDLWLGYPNYPFEGNQRGYFEATQGVLEITPDKWDKDFHVERLQLEEPKIRISAHVAPWWDGAAAEVVKASKEPSRVKFWERWHFEELQVEDGILDVDVNPKIHPKVEAKWEISTQLRNDESSLHLLDLTDISALLPESVNSPFPILQIQNSRIGVRLPELWSHRHLESLSISNASMEASQKLVESYSSEGEPEVSDFSEMSSKLPKKPLVLKSWTVGVLHVEDSYISVSELIPGIPTLRFGVGFHTENAPLEWDSLQSHLETQTINLSQISIPSPYEPLRNVAFLDEVNLTFSLKGLVHKTIDKVEIVRPKLFVGEDLFWYVDYYRNYNPVEFNMNPPVGWSVRIDTEPMLAPPHDFEEELMIFKSLRNLKEEWTVIRLEVRDGELILAPKGKPIKGFSKPFPFQLSSELARGTLEAKLDIPVDTYTMEELELELVGMRGEVQFNLPLKTRDNNLVETFQVNAIRWKDLRTGPAYLTLTYDAMGIYAKFGAEAYKGYVNGEVNVYLDDSYHWDAWVSGKTVNSSEITQKFSPGYFILDGNVDLTLIGQGSSSEIYHADLDFTNSSQGKLSIVALNDLLKELPGDPKELNDQLTKIGVETLRDFEYDQATGKARIYGREGKGSLSFVGPYGSRVFEVNVYDHRWKVEESDNIIGR